MAEARKARPKGAKSIQKADLVEMAAATAENTAVPEPAPQPAVPAARAVGIETLFSSMQEQGDTFRQAVNEAVAVSAKGALEVNGKIIEALQAQSDAALDLWQRAISASHLPEALQAQTSVTREAYATASAQWKDIATTTARWVTRSLEPLQTALYRQGR